MAYLLAVMEHRNVAAAAKSLGVTRQAVFRGAAAAARWAPHIDGWAATLRDR
jgi:DNA-binding transcriptional LysR family regulator